LDVKESAKRAVSRLKHDLYEFNPFIRRTFNKEFDTLKEQAIGRKRFLMSPNDTKIIMDERSETTIFDVHYIYHLAWASQIIEKTRPVKHVDISSSTYFPSLISAFVPFEYYEYQPSGLKLNNLDTGKADLLRLPFKDDSIRSLSCMHVVEHIGLGRYGDPLDYDGDIKAASELNRVLAPGGDLLFVVPVGKPRIQFNAHRIYDFDLVVDLFPKLDLKETALIYDDGKEGLHYNAPKADFSRQKYGCGCFRFVKPLA
jgi:SAM-dependent methyltransferase